MTFDQPCEVLIRHIGFGAVMIGEEPVAPAGAVTLDILGATLDFDPSRPDRLPSCLVAEPDMAVPVLEQIFGNTLATGVLDRALERNDEVVSCPVVRQPSLELLTRLAEVRWCQRYAALSLDPGLLLLEELTLLATLRGILDIDESWVVELFQLLEALMTRPKAVHAAVAQPAVKALLIDSLDILVGELSPLSTDHGKAIAWSRAFEEDASPAAGPVTVPELLEQLRPELALAAGAPPTAGTSTVDWRDIPLGLLSRREDNVRWQVEQGDGWGRITATVQGAGDVFRLLGEAPTLPGGICFDVLSAKWPLPIASGKLSLEHDGRQWSGAVDLSAGQAALLRRLTQDAPCLEVRVRGVSPEQRGDQRVAEAERWCARAVNALRLRNILAPKELLGSAEGALEHAAILWESAGRSAEREATLGLLERARDDTVTWAETLTVAETILVAEQGP